MKILLLLQLFISLVFGTNPDQQYQGQGNYPHPEWKEEVTRSQMDFAVSIYQQISTPTIRPPPKIFLSPLSIYITLSMVDLGAHGKTRDEILNALGLNDKDTVLHEGNKKILDAIRQQTKGEEFKLGNEVFIKKGGFLPHFQDYMELYYNAPINTISFSDPQAAEKTINKLVSDKTDHKIQHIVHDLSPETSMVLLDYALFLSNWKSEFCPKNTKGRNFTLINGKQLEVPMMNRQGLYPTYRDTENQCDVVELPYAGNISLLIIVPQPHQFYRVQETLTPKKIKEYVKSVRSSFLDLYLPKVKFDYRVSLKHYLMSMGMESMFSKDANFFRFSGDKDLQVSDMYHQTYISFEEKGTEENSGSDAKLNNFTLFPAFRVDRPYILLFFHRITETILGIGEILNPVWKNPWGQGEGRE